MMYSESDQVGILDVLEIKIFATKNHGGEPFTDFIKYYVDFTLWWWYHCNFLEKRKKVK